MDFSPLEFDMDMDDAQPEFETYFGEQASFSQEESPTKRPFLGIFGEDHEDSEQNWMLRDQDYPTPQSPQAASSPPMDIPISPLAREAVHHQVRSHLFFLLRTFLGSWRPDTAVIVYPQEEGSMSAALMHDSSSTVSPWVDDASVATQWCAGQWSGFVGGMAYEPQPDTDTWNPPPPPTTKAWLPHDTHAATVAAAPVSDAVMPVGPVSIPVSPSKRRKEPPASPQLKAVPIDVKFTKTKSGERKRRPNKNIIPYEAMIAKLRALPEQPDTQILGKSFLRDELRSLLKKHGISYHKPGPANLMKSKEEMAQDLLDLLANGAIITDTNPQSSPASDSLAVSLA